MRSVTVSIPPAIIAAARAETAALYNAFERECRAVLAQRDAGCRGFAQPPSSCGRAIFLKHEFPRPPLLLRMLGARVRCHCGDATT